jgi:cytochrome c biogenesis protein CcdA
MVKTLLIISIVLLQVVVPVLAQQVDGSYLLKDFAEVPIIGRINLELPVPLLGMILGFIDGAFNPCALSVLFFLIAYLMALGSKRKCLIIGLTYSMMVFIVYFSFMYGFLNIISMIGYLGLIKSIIGVIVIIAGIIELKDFFFYGRWVSLEIPKSAKPTIEKLVKTATIPSAILLGFFVSLVEIPCAGAFPLIYLAILAEKVSGMMNVVYLLWYNLFFVLPLIGLTLVFYLGLLRVEKAEEKRLKTRRYMRLLAGLVMVTLGIAMLMRVI